MSVDTFALTARARVLTCRACALSDTCRSPVPWHGPAPNPSAIAVVGEAPGETEDRLGIPFTGRSGRLLDTIWRKAGLPKPSILNVVSCRPPDNRKPTPVEIASCRPNLDAQLFAIRPTYLLLLGETALETFRPNARIADWRGRPWWGAGNKRFVASYHPAYALRTADAERVIAQDVATFKAVVGGWWPEECGCGQEAVMYTTDGQPRCSASCPGRICARCRKGAAFRVSVDGRRFLMCMKHAHEMEQYKGVVLEVA